VSTSCPHKTPNQNKKRKSGRKEEEGGGERRRRRGREKRERVVEIVATPNLSVLNIFVKELTKRPDRLISENLRRSPPGARSTSPK